MRKIAVILIIALLWLCDTTNGQSASTMKFNEQTWDFGTIKEIDGVVTHKFEFKNTGSTPFVIEAVTTSCGCTTPKYSREPIMPSKTGYVEITYNPEGRPGQFRKDIIILSNDRKNRNTIVITGKVTPSPRTIEDEYPIAVGGGLYVPRTNLGMGYLPRESTKSTTLEYFNRSNKSITLGVRYINREPYFNVAFSSPILKANEGGTMTITYDLRKTDIWGRVNNDFNILIDSKPESIKFSASGIVTQDFSEYGREQIDAAPKGVLSLQYYNFSVATRGKVLSHEFTLTNRGKSDLIIQYLGKTDNTTTTLSSTTVLAPGKATTFTVSMNTSNMPEGNALESITIITNDPTRPMQEVRLAAVITK